MMLDKIFSLPIVKQISPHISQRDIDGFPLIVITHPKVRSAISIQGAHLMAWQPSGEKPILWLSNNTKFRAGTAIRGGIPICWPWFGPQDAPSHGFARILPWEFKGHHEHENGVILMFILQNSEYTKQLWPHEFTLIARFKLGETCEIELESYGDYQTTCALHSYFNISSIEKVQVSGLGHHFIDSITNKKQQSTSEKLTFQGRTDRIYTEPEDFSLISDKQWKRTIEIHHYHHSDIVCWNPGAELSGSMQDMENESYKTMVCVETARISSPLHSKNGNPGKLSVVLRCRQTS